MKEVYCPNVDYNTSKCYNEIISQLPWLQGITLGGLRPEEGEAAAKFKAQRRGGTTYQIFFS